MIILNTDLDNTIIYSYKHDIGNDKINVEIYKEKQISFITRKTYSLLKKLNKDILIVPTSTRTIEQYNRINLNIGKIKYALVCNGGILLVNGVKDEKWYEESLKNVSESKQELEKAINLLTKENRRTMELRFIEQLFIFTKCVESENVVEDLKKVINKNLVDVFNNGEKVYVVPKRLSKGVAVKRFKKYIKGDYVISAGDSEFDISMLCESDIGLAPYGFSEKYKIDADIIEAKENEVFSDFLLNKCLKIKDTYNV